MKWLISSGLGVLLAPVMLLALLVPAAVAENEALCLAASAGQVVDPGEQGDTDNAAYIWAALRDAGISEAGAAGVLGNLHQETGGTFAPTTAQPGGPGRGIAQWSLGGRWDGPAGLVPWARDKNLDPWSLRAQVMFLLHEVQQGWGGISLGRLRGMSNPVTAAIYFHDTYERSADSAAFVADVRGGNATTWLARLGGTATPTPPANVTAWIAGGTRTADLAHQITQRHSHRGGTARITAPLPADHLVAVSRERAAQTADVWILATPPSTDLVATVLASAGPTRAVTWLARNRADREILEDVADTHPTLTVATGGTRAADYDPPPHLAAPTVDANPTGCVINASGGSLICPASDTIENPDQLKDNATQVARCVAAGWPSIDVIGGWRPSDPYPDHPSGQAVDIMMPQGCTDTAGKTALGKQITEYLTSRAAQFRIMYLIWEQRIWTVNTPQWRPMSSRGSCTADHYDHIHVSTWEPPPGNPSLGSQTVNYTPAPSAMRPCPPRFACGTNGLGDLTGTPGHIVDAVVEWAAGQGTITGPGEKMSIPAVWRANDSHGSTVTGSRSDHQGPPSFAWAVDIFDPSDPHGPTEKKDRMAQALAAAYGIPWNGSGLVNRTVNGLNIQLIYRTQTGGNHFNHIHFGVRRTTGRVPAIPTHLVFSS